MIANVNIHPAAEDHPSGRIIGTTAQLRLSGDSPHVEVLGRVDDPALVEYLEALAFEASTLAAELRLCRVEAERKAAKTA